MKDNQQSKFMILTQSLLWLCVFLVPALTGALVSRDMGIARLIFGNTLFYTVPMFVVYMINYFGLVPHLYFKEHKVIFFLLNLILIVGMDVLLYVHPGRIPEAAVYAIGWEGVLWMGLGYALVMMTLHSLCVALAIGARNSIRLADAQANLRDAQQKATEAELNWLKYQLNPHFLFNTLNNISSLTQIDPDKAQDSIGQLSDLLRYELYESNHEKVPLSGEVDFMKDYISLMKLRCNEMTTVEEDFECPDGDRKIAPLLFISLIENAFKHGTNVRHESLIKMKQSIVGDDLRFTCSNTIQESQSSDHIGSGIGLENLRKRLDLIYPGKYEYSQSVDGNVYTATVVLKNFMNE